MLKKRLGKKGFTLVEIIVVLVILAILAAIMIPSMVKWIDKAEEKSAVVAGRSVLLASQTIASENYATQKTATAFTTEQIAEIVTLVDIDEFTAFSTVPTIDGGQVTGFAFQYGTGGPTVTYAQGTGFKVEKAAAGGE